MTHKAFHEKDIFLRSKNLNDLMVINELFLFVLAFNDDQIFSLDALVYFILAAYESCLLFRVIGIKVRDFFVLLYLYELCGANYIISLCFVFFSNNTKSFLLATRFKFWIEIVSDLDWQSEYFAFEGSFD